jgi:hypothetical protein
MPQAATPVKQSPAYSQPPPAQNSMTEKIKDLISQNKVMMFSKDYCPFCKKA